MVTENYWAWVRNYFGFGHRCAHSIMYYLDGRSFHLALGPPNSKSLLGDEAFHNRCGDFVFSEDFCLLPQLDVRDEHRAPQFMRAGYHLVGQTGAIHVKGHITELVEGHGVCLADIRQKLVVSPRVKSFQLEHWRYCLEEACQLPSPCPLVPRAIAFASRRCLGCRVCLRP